MKGGKKCVIRMCEKTKNYVKKVKEILEEEFKVLYNIKFRIKIVKYLKWLDTDFKL